MAGGFCWGSLWECSFFWGGQGVNKYHLESEKNINAFLHGYHVPYGDFLKWWYPTTMGFPIKNGHFGEFWGYHHLRKTVSFGISSACCEPPLPCLQPFANRRFPLGSEKNIAIRTAQL